MHAIHLLNTLLFAVSAQAAVAKPDTSSLVSPGSSVQPGPSSATKPAPTNLRLRPWRLPSSGMTEKVIVASTDNEDSAWLAPAPMRPVPKVDSYSIDELLLDDDATVDGDASPEQLHELETHHDASYHRSRIHLVKRAGEAPSDREHIQSVRSGAGRSSLGRTIARIQPTATQLLTAQAGQATATQSDKVISTGLLTVPSRSDADATDPAMINAETLSSKAGGWTSTVVVLATGSSDDVGPQLESATTAEAPVQSLSLQETNGVARVGGPQAMMLSLIAIVALLW